MKNILTIMMAAAFVLTLGTAAYAVELNNGITDFTGRSYDNFEIDQAKDEMNMVNGAAAGGMRDKGAAELYNGVTDFTGRSYDSFEIGTPSGKMNAVEGSSAGSLRMDTRDEKPYNGVTDFSGRSYDDFEIDR